MNVEMNELCLSHTYLGINEIIEFHEIFIEF